MMQLQSSPNRLQHIQAHLQLILLLQCFVSHIDLTLSESTEWRIHVHKFCEIKDHDQNLSTYATSMWRCNNEESMGF